MDWRRTSALGLLCGGCGAAPEFRRADFSRSGAGSSAFRRMQVGSVTPRSAAAVRASPGTADSISASRQASAHSHDVAVVPPALG